MDKQDLNKFLLSYPGMSIKPSRANEIILEGKFSFIAKVADEIEIEDYYDLRISIPKGFPQELPKVIETSNKIPRDGNHHINPDDTLCLGSTLRLLSISNSNPTIVGYVERCLVPYLYTISIKNKYGDDFIFGELEHGSEGLIDDYMDLFGLETQKQLEATFRLIGMKKRIANKEKCPCGCGNRLGICRFNIKVCEYRKIIPKSYFENTQ